MAEQFANHPGTTLSGAISSTTRPVTFSVASATGLPSSGNFRVIIGSEILLITSISGTSLTGTNVEGTSASTYANGAAVTHVVTAGALAQMEVDANATLLAANNTFTGSNTFSGAVSVGSRLAMTPSNFQTNTSAKVLIMGSTGTTLAVDAVTVAFGYDPSTINDSSWTGTGKEIIFRNVAQFWQPNLANTGFFQPITMNSGNVGISTTVPKTALHVLTTGTANQQRVLTLEQTTATAVGADLSFYKNRGTRNSPSAVLSGDALGSVTFTGYDGTTDLTSAQRSAYLEGHALENWNSGAHGSNIQAFITPTGSTAAALAMTIDSSGVTFANAISAAGVITQTGGNRAVINTSGFAGLQFAAHSKNWYLDHRGSIDTPNDRFAFETDALEVLTLLNGGNVGISNSNPGSLFTIGANKLTVDASGNVTATGVGSFASLAGLGSATVGSATISFGAAPGTNVVSTVVTGQTAIKSTSTVMVFMAYDSTATHNVNEHLLVAFQLRAGSLVAGTGFTIYAESDLRLTGDFTVRWLWV
jgi:hypothetical protein